MEKRRQSFAVNGWLKLPIGFRFHPTDEELLDHYLKRKVFGLPLPASVIPEWDVFHTDPWRLPGDVMEERYFFRKEKGNESQIKCKRTTSSGCGYWKPIGKDKQILGSASNQPIGVRKTLVFCNTRHSNKSKTQWVMHEYRLAGGLATIFNAIQVSRTKLENWVAYHIFQRKIRTRKLGAIFKSSNIDMAQRIDDVTIRPAGMAVFKMEEEGFCTAGPPPEPSSPCSSGITEISSNGSDQEDISHSITSSSYSNCMRKA